MEVQQLGKWMDRYGIDIALGTPASNALGLTAPGEQITVRELAVDDRGWKHCYARFTPDGGFLFIAVDLKGGGITSFRADAAGNLVSVATAMGGVVRPIEPAAAQAEYRAQVDYWADLADQSLCPEFTTGPSSVAADVVIARCTAVIQSPDATSRLQGYAYRHRSVAYGAKGDAAHQAEDQDLAAKALAKVR